MSRTDKFRPSVIDPTKFEFVAQHYLGPISDDFAMSGICEEMAAEQEALEAHQDAHPGFTVAGHKWPGQCDCCGARYLWGATFHTAESNTYISIGGICAGKLRLGSPEAMKTFREQVNTWKVHAERVAAARAYLTSIGLVAMLDMYLDKNNTSREFPEVTLRDMTAKVVRWALGTSALSDKQQAFARSLLKQIADRPRILAEREARDAARKPVPRTDKRVTVEGVIVSAKYDEGGWKDERGNDRNFFRPECIKIVVEHADGWRVWGTLPGGCYTAPDGKWMPMEKIAAAVKGKRIKFDARVTVSDKDDKFGFFKRPTKAAIIDQQEAIAA